MLKIYVIRKLAEKREKTHNKLNSSNTLIDLIKTAVIRYAIRIFLFLANSTLDYPFLLFEICCSDPANPYS